jgi:sugar O-acyltransferase (sialic acid O-acetyltransferase NeuD family)
MEFWIIVGARGLGREVLSQARGDGAHNRDWMIFGFLDSAGPSILPEDCDIPVIGDPATYIPRPRERYLPAIGDPFAKEKYLAPLIEKGAIFASLRTDVRIGERTEIGVGVIFGLGGRVSSDSVIGDYVYIDCGTQIGHDVEIGDYSHIGTNVFIGGNTKIGKNVTIHPMASISRGVTIGDGAVIGMGSVVLRDVPPNQGVLGNPARIIGTTSHARDSAVIDGSLEVPAEPLRKTRKR